MTALLAGAAAHYSAAQYLSAPVIPGSFNDKPTCEPGASFCWGWIQNNWTGTLAPRLIEHIYMTAIAVGIGLVISLIAAVIAYRHDWFERGFSGLATFLYTIPALGFFFIMIPITGITLLTVEIALTGYTLLLLFRNILTGLQSIPPEVQAAAEGMGMTQNQILRKITFPMAMPSIMTGIRIATVTAISLATVAADATPLGLGQPIFFALHTVFRPELIAAGALIVILALVADSLIVGLQRLVTPWARARRS